MRSTVGQYAVTCVTSAKASAEFVRQCLSITGELERKIDGCVQGFLLSVNAKMRAAIMSAVAKGADADGLARLFRLAPFEQDTWRLLDQYGEETRRRYWQEVFPHWGPHTEAELIELIDRLLEADRPRAAFHAVHMGWPQIETSRLKRLLLTVATSNAEPSGTFQLSAYDISAGLQSLNGRSGVNPEEMAQLEFLFIRALDHSEHGIPNLERQMSESPAIFVQAVALTYKRNDDGEDPPEWQIENPEQRSSVASAAYRLLDQIKRIPGTDRDGTIESDALAAWLKEVRPLCARYGRAKMGDQCIGQLLSKAPAGENGIWPCLPVCEAMEGIASPQIADGFIVGVHNARGAHWRGEGGAQERDLAAKYRGWAQKLRFDFPYVGSVLERIAASYEKEAEWQDSDAKVSKRLRY